MRNFNDTLVEYLKVFGDYVRANGYEMEYRGIQRYLYNLASIIEAEDLEALVTELEDMKEELANAIY